MAPCEAMLRFVFASSTNLFLVHVLSLVQVSRDATGGSHRKRQATMVERAQRFAYKYLGQRSRWVVWVAWLVQGVRGGKYLG